MIQKNTIATIFGGTGFLGRQIVRELAARGVTVKIASRIPEKAALLKPCGAVGQIVPIMCNYNDPKSVSEAVRGSDIVINCIGILFERGKKKTFKRIHVDLPALIAKASAQAGVRSLVHISALGCDVSDSKYSKSKLEGEKAVFASFPRAVILRPSVIFGVDDQFFNMFAELARYLPFLPLIGGGKTKLQPVYVGDVADAAIAAIMSQSSDMAGRVYQLGGPDVLDFKQLYEKMFEYTGRRRCLISVPFVVAKLEGRVLSLLPKPLLTPDQVETLKFDNIVVEGALGFGALGVVPKSLDAILPQYLEIYRKGGRFHST